MKALNKLIEIASEPLLNEIPVIEHFQEFNPDLKEIAKNVFELLSIKNGFLAFESALQVFPSASGKGVPGIFDWNANDGWRRYYDNIQSSILFFAQDLFACQFGISPSGIVHFDPEAGEIKMHSVSLEEWAQKILIDYDFETGWSIGKKWQEINGVLANEFRLLGKIPFVMGGKYEHKNMKAVRLYEAMDKLGNLYQQIKDIPDGKALKVKGWIA